MGEETERTRRLLRGFVFAMGILGVLCSMSIQFYGLLQAGALVPESTVRLYKVVGWIVMVASVVSVFLFDIMVKLFWGGMPSRKKRTVKRLPLGVKVFLLATGTSYVFLYLTDNVGMTVVFALAILLLSVGIGILWRSRGVE